MVDVFSFFFKTFVFFRLSFATRQDFIGDALEVAVDQGDMDGIRDLEAIVEPVEPLNELFADPGVQVRQDVPFDVSSVATRHVGHPLILDTPRHPGDRRHRRKTRSPRWRVQPLGESLWEFVGRVALGEQELLEMSQVHQRLDRSDDAMGRRRDEAVGDDGPPGIDLRPPFDVALDDLEQAFVAQSGHQVALSPF